MPIYGKVLFKELVFCILFQMAWVNADAQDGTNSATDADLSPAFRSNSEQRVGFHSQGGANNDDYKEREKYLTAKYPKHTMGLIRKRLAVEDWIDDQLKRIYNLVSCC